MQRRSVAVHVSHLQPWHVGRTWAQPQPKRTLRGLRAAQLLPHAVHVAAGLGHAPVGLGRRLLRQRHRGLPLLKVPVQLCREVRCYPFQLG